MTFPVPAQQGSTAPAAPSRLRGGEILSRAFGVWGENVVRFTVLMLLSMIPGVVASIIVLRVAEGAGEMGDGEGLGTARLVLLLGAGVIGSLVQTGGLTYGALQHLGMGDVGVGRMLGAGVGGLWRLVPTWILCQMIVAGGLTMLVIPGLVFASALSLAVPAALAERIGPFRAIARSWKLSRGHRASIFAAYFALLIILVVLTATSALLGFGLLGGLARLAIFFFVGGVASLMPAVVYQHVRIEAEGASSAAIADGME